METVKQRIEELTPSEKRRLSKSLLGYGKLTEASKKSNIHFNTLRNIQRLGYGKPETIEKLRNNLLTGSAA